MKVTTAYTNARTMLLHRLRCEYGVQSFEFFANAYETALDDAGYPLEAEAMRTAKDTYFKIIYRLTCEDPDELEIKCRGLDDETFHGACIFYLAMLSVHVDVAELSKMLDDVAEMFENIVDEKSYYRKASPGAIFRPYRQLVAAFNDLLDGMNAEATEPEEEAPIETHYRPSAVERSLYNYLGALVNLHGFEVVQEAINLSKFDPDYSDMLAMGCFLFEQLESSAERILKSIKAHGVGEQVNDLETERRSFVDALITRNAIDTVDELLTGMTFDMVTHENVEELAADMLIDETEMLCFTLSAMIANINYK